jgi:DNA-binding transcriptional ArsR family regulator
MPRTDTTPQIDGRIFKALSHPLRPRILHVLSERVASPKEIAQELGESLGTVSYHVKILREYDCIELVDTQPRRGAIEHMYKAAGRVRVSDTAWAQVPSIVKEAMVGASLEQSVRYVEQALIADGFERAESHLSRQPLKLDDQGWRELSGEVAKLLDRAREIEKESADRLGKNGGDDAEGFNAGLVMMLFEAATADPGPVPEDDGHAPERARSSQRSPS